MFIIIKIIIETLPKAQRTHARHWVLWLIIHLSKGKLVWQDCGGIREPYCKFSKSMITPIGNMIITIITMIRWHRGLPAGKKPLTNLKFSIPTTLGRVSSGWEAQALPGRRGDSIMFRIKYPITQQPYNTDTVTHHPQNTNAQQTYCIITQTQALHLFFFLQTMHWEDFCSRVNYCSKALNSGVTRFMMLKDTTNDEADHPKSPQNIQYPANQAIAGQHKAISILYLLGSFIRVTC